MKKIALIIVLALILSPLHSCKKDDEPTKTELLTDGIWKGVKLDEYHDNELFETSSIAGLQFNFRTDYTTILVIDNEEETGTWDFLNNETQIYVTVNGINGNPTLNTTYEIETLTEASLILSFEDWIDDDGLHKFVFTFRH